MTMGDVFIIEATVGGVRLKLSTGDNKSFLLKRSAEEIHVDFSCFSGTLCITSSSSFEPADASECSQPLVTKEEPREENIAVETAQESALPADAMHNDSRRRAPESERPLESKRDDKSATQSEGSEHKSLKRGLL